VCEKEENNTIEERQKVMIMMVMMAISIDAPTLTGRLHYETKKKKVILFLDTMK